ncbi:MAG: hypothetical protein AMQ22_01089 [Candidatus Methanofastidiosum methylothiophilum]|uniref:Uncharacterized protein n=1 Tax=Candidatus Methanofastidiosum methylothiophilum TaxID=1705564 RepID=A0A150J4R8_9EURY|nr:MAG: hypothetical protein AMQ22_01089 [Candidatus Methanofastidiosum methylthiophilus]
MKIITTSQSKYPKILGQDFSSNVLIGFEDKKTNRKNYNLRNDALIEMYDMSENDSRTIKINIENKSEIPIFIDKPTFLTSTDIDKNKPIDDAEIMSFDFIVRDEKTNITHKENAPFFLESPTTQTEYDDTISKTAHSLTFGIGFFNRHYTNIASQIQISYSPAKLENGKWVRSSTIKYKKINFLHSKINSVAKTVVEEAKKILKITADAVFDTGGYVTTKVTETSPPALRWLLENGQYIVIGVVAILAIGLVMFLLKDDD